MAQRTTTPALSDVHNRSCHQPACPGTPETWRPIPGYEGAYKVSDHGRVRSLPRTIPTSHTNQSRTRREPGGILSTAGPRPNVRLDGNHRPPRTIHTLVLESFVGPCPPGMECCHHDDNSRNNHLANLRWDTQSGNRRDLLRNGRNHNANKTHCPHGHLLSQPNLHRSALRNGHRICLTCHRSREFLRYRKITDPEERQQVVARYYEEIMRGAS